MPLESMPEKSELGWIVTIDPNQLKFRANTAKVSTRSASLRGSVQSEKQSTSLTEFETISKLGQVLFNHNPLDSSGRRLLQSDDATKIMIRLSDEQLAEFKAKFEDSAISRIQPNGVVELVGSTKKPTAQPTPKATASPVFVPPPVIPASEKWGKDDTDSSAYNGISITDLTDGEGTLGYVLDTGVNQIPSEFLKQSGISAIDGYSGTQDLVGHGTHVASIMLGVEYGVAPGAELVSVKIFPDSTIGTASDLIRGSSMALEDYKKRLSEGKKYRRVVINYSVSFGRGFEAELDLIYKEFTQLGIFIIPAAGNMRKDACSMLPAGMNAELVGGEYILTNKYPTLITVGGLNIDESLYSGSNTGICVDVYQPAQDITAMVNIGQAVKKSGTSMAAPNAAGIILRASSNKYPELTPAQLKEKLIRDSKTLGSVMDYDCGNRPVGIMLMDKQVPLEQLELNPSVLQLTSPPQLAFAPLEQADFAAISFTVGASTTPVSLDLGLLSGELPLGFQAYLDTPVSCRNENFNARKIPLSITNAGNYWAKIYKVNNNYMLDIGSGNTIGSSVIKVYNLDVAPYNIISGSDPLKTFAFSSTSSVIIDNFKGYGNFPEVVATPAPVVVVTMPPSTARPTLQPITASPTTKQPTAQPSSISPTKEPTARPISASPTKEPTARPISASPTTKQPTAQPISASPTFKPTKVPTTVVPTTVVPTTDPTVEPTPEPTVITAAPVPTKRPTISTRPTATPTVKTESPITASPSVGSTMKPTTKPTVKPTADPTAKPTQKPTADPTLKPTAKPIATKVPTVKTEAPSESTSNPSVTPSFAPTFIETQSNETWSFPPSVGPSHNVSNNATEVLISGDDATKLVSGTVAIIVSFLALLMLWKNKDSVNKRIVKARKSITSSTLYSGFSKSSESTRDSDGSGEDTLAVYATGTAHPMLSVSDDDDPEIGRPIVKKIIQAKENAKAEKKAGPASEPDIKPIKHGIVKEQIAAKEKNTKLVASSTFTKEQTNVADKTVSTKSASPILSPMQGSGSVKSRTEAFEPKAKEAKQTTTPPQSQAISSVQSRVKAFEPKAKDVKQTTTPAPIQSGGSVQSRKQVFESKDVKSTTTSAPIQGGGSVQSRRQAFESTDAKPAIKAASPILPPAQGVKTVQSKQVFDRSSKIDEIKPNKVQQLAAAYQKPAEVSESKTSSPKALSEARKAAEALKQDESKKKAFPYNPTPSSKPSSEQRPKSPEQKSGSVQAMIAARNAAAAKADKEQKGTKPSDNDKFKR